MATIPQPYITLSITDLMDALRDLDETHGMIITDESDLRDGLKAMFNLRELEPDEPPTT